MQSSVCGVQGDLLMLNIILSREIQVKKKNKTEVLDYV